MQDWMPWGGSPLARVDRPRVSMREVYERVLNRAAPTVNRIAGQYGPMVNRIARVGLDMVPGVGDVLAAEDLGQAAARRDPVGIAAGLVAAAPLIPGAGRAVRGAGRSRTARSAAVPAPPPARVQPTSPPTPRVQARTPEPPAPTPNEVIRAYHGSPHSFDRFSLDKIGTGEGAQAYGHGLYFAENEDVARSYRDDLSIRIDFDGQPLLDRNQIYNRLPDSTADDYLVASRGNVDEALRKLDEDVASILDYYPGRDVSDYRAARDFLEANRDRISVSNPGSMYEVDINARPDTFLDWDRPLSEQAPPVRDAVNRVARDVQPYGLDRITDDMRGVELKRMLQAPEATQRLSQEGVSGIRYLDGGSRGAGEGSRNYVVFDDALVKILRKYGIGALGLGVGSAAFSEGLLPSPEAQ